MSRRYHATADGGRYPADDDLGLDGALTRAAPRMAAFASARDSSARANAARTELAGWTLDRESLRQFTHGTARRLAVARPDRDDAARFARAGGVIEVAVDAGKVNAIGSWRDVTVAVLCKRTLGPPASADGWANRQLPAPTVRAVVANIEDSAAFAGRVRAETDRLDATTAADGTVLADGAEWIGTLAGDVRPQAAGVLDVYHVAEHIADAVNAIWPAGEPADELFAGGRAAVLTGGQAGLERWIGAAFGARPAWSDGEPLRARTRTSPRTRSTRTVWRAAGASAADRWRGDQATGEPASEANRRAVATGTRRPARRVGGARRFPDWDAVWTAA